MTDKSKLHLPLVDVEDLVRHAESHHRLLVQLNVSASGFLQRDSKRAKLRERILLLRNRARYDWMNCHNYRQFVEHSLQEFQKQAAALFTSPRRGFTQQLDALRRCHEMVSRDFEHQNKLAETVNAAQVELGLLEYEVERLEESMKQSTDRMKVILNQLELPAYSTAATVAETDNMPPPSEQSSEELNPLVENYFKNLGAVRDVLEQKLELEADYNAELGERDFKIEHDQPLDLSEGEFEALWQDKRLAISRRLAETQRVASSALDTCLNEGLDPNEFRHRPQPEYDRSLPNSESGDEGGPGQIQLPAINVQEVFDAGARPMDSFFGEATGPDPSALPDQRPNSAPLQTQPASFAPGSADQRVLSWITQVGQQNDDLGLEAHIMHQTDALRRRSIASSSPFSQPSRSQIFTPFPGPELSPQNIYLVEAAQRATSTEAELPKRRSLDSNLRAVSSKYEPGWELDEGLRRFSEQGVPC